MDCLPHTRTRRNYGEHAAFNGGGPWEIMRDSRCFGRATCLSAINNLPITSSYGVITTLLWPKRGALYNTSAVVRNAGPEHLYRFRDNVQSCDPTND